MARREHCLEQRTGLRAAANSGERVNLPEGADVAGHFGRPEIVRLRVAMQEPAMNEVALDLREGAEEAGVVGLQEPELEQAEQAGVAILAADGGNQAGEAHVPETGRAASRVRVLQTG